MRSWACSLPGQLKPTSPDTSYLIEYPAVADPKNDSGPRTAFDAVSYNRISPSELFRVLGTHAPSPPLFVSVPGTALPAPHPGLIRAAASRNSSRYG